MLALVSPGQGAQTPGMLAPWLELPAVAERLRWACAVTGIDLIRLGTSGSAEEIRDTAVAQPLLVAMALAVA
ncbi:MAG TPA: ACP S-malonyltransferase, partial [Mycobacteriales bacterium]|nr:ACP S-malonyltransferase [Mycobacteriales bacterium]